MENLTISLVDLLGAEYVDSVCRAAASLGLGDEKSLQSLGREKVECWPADYAEKVRNLLQKSGERICEPFADNNTGAPTDAFGSHVLHKLSFHVRFELLSVAVNLSIQIIKT